MTINDLISVAVPTAVTGLVYNGKEQVGVAATNGYYTVSVGSAVYAGTYYAVATLTDTAKTRWADGTTTDKTITWTIAKAENPAQATTITKTVKYKKVLKKKVTFNIGMTNVQGTVKYVVPPEASISGIVVKANGKVVVKKNALKGLYTITAVVTGNTNYNDKMITIYVRVS